MLTPSETQYIRLGDESEDPGTPSFNALMLRCNGVVSPRALAQVIHRIAFSEGSIPLAVLPRNLLNETAKYILRVEAFDKGPTGKVVQCVRKCQHDLTFSVQY